MLFTSLIIIKAQQKYMIKLLLLLSFCISTLSFNFVNQNLENRFGKDLNAIPWPFTLCSDNVDWKI